MKSCFLPGNKNFSNSDPLPKQDVQSQCVCVGGCLPNQTWWEIKVRFFSTETKASVWLFPSFWQSQEKGAGQTLQSLISLEMVE